MRDGQVENDYVWFRFDAQELEWLHGLIPAGDEFKTIVAIALKRLEEREREESK